MSETKSQSRPLLFAAGFYIASGLYLLAFTLTSLKDLWSLTALSIVSILAGVGLYLMRRWSFWLAIILFPLLATVAASTLVFSMSIPSKDGSVATTLFNISLGLLLFFSFVSVIIVGANRNSLGESPPESSQTKPTRSP